MAKNDRCTELVKCFCVIVILILFLTSIHFSISGNDEAFTLALVNHSYIRLIHMDLLDVHPPLYYLLLKSFLLATTFWTKSIFIQVIAARLFSILSFMLFLFFIDKIMSLCNVNVSRTAWLIFFMIFPQVTLFSTRIRMYSLVTLFLILDFYCLIMFYRGNDKYLFGVILFAILTFYTFYISAISVMVFILIYYFLLFRDKNYKSLFKLSVSIIMIVLACIPWLPFLYKQFTTHSKYDINSNAFPIAFYFKDVVTSMVQSGGAPLYLIPLSLLILVSFIIFVFHVIKWYKSLFTQLLCISVLDGVVTLMLSLIICRLKFQFMALYPIFAIYFSFIIVIMINMLLNNRHKLLIYFVLFISILYSGSAINNNVENSDIPSVKLINIYNRWSKYRSNNIYVNMNKYSSNANAYNEMAQNSIYLKPIGKKEILLHSNYSKLSKYITNDTHNIQLVKKLFNNLSIW